jgi:hypothetical protein
MQRSSAASILLPVQTNRRCNFVLLARYGIDTAPAFQPYGNPVFSLVSRVAARTGRLVDDRFGCGETVSRAVIAGYEDDILSECNFQMPGGFIACPAKVCAIEFRVFPNSLLAVVSAA